MIVILFLFLTFPVTGDASYRIRLKNGGEFKTLRYWSEGSQLRFYIYGGIAGIPKDSVRKVEKITPENILYRRSDNDQKPAKISSKTNTFGDEKTKEEIDLSYYIKRKKQLVAETDRAVDRLREATRNRDAEAKKREREKLKEIHNEIYALTEEVKEKNRGKIPEGWWKQK